MKIVLYLTCYFLKLFVIWSFVDKKNRRKNLVVLQKEIKTKSFFSKVAVILAERERDLNIKQTLPGCYFNFKCGRLRYM